RQLPERRLVAMKLVQRPEEILVREVLQRIGSQESTQVHELALELTERCLQLAEACRHTRKRAVTSDEAGPALVHIQRLLDESQPRRSTEVSLEHPLHLRVSGAIRARRDACPRAAEGTVGSRLEHLAQRAERQREHVGPSDP